jgi:signal transduction histidine kinase
MQQADGWREPELSGYGTATNTDLANLNAGLDASLDGAGFDMGSAKLEEPSLYVSEQERSTRLLQGRSNEAGQPGEQAESQTVPAPGRLSWLEMSLSRPLPEISIVASQATVTQLVPTPGKTGLRDSSEGGEPRNQLPPLADGLAGQIGALAHDARNMLSALDLYCDLLEEPGVLWAPFSHYAGELRLVAGASRRLVERLAMLECAEDQDDDRGGAQEFIAARYSPTNYIPMLSRPERASPNQSSPEQQRLESNIVTMRQHQAALHGLRPVASLPSKPAGPASPSQLPQDNPALLGRRRILHVVRSIESLAEELLANQNLLSALAGPGITVGVSIAGGQRPIAMSGDDLTRVLVNLVKNAADAMPSGGHIQIALEEAVPTAPTAKAAPPARRLRLSVADTGCGIPADALDGIFTAGYSTHLDILPAAGEGVWPTHHRGLGLAIVRSLVSAAGGTSRAENQAGGRGAIIQLEFPVPD